MNGFLANVGSHLAGLIRFAGREDRSSFWTYASLVIGLACLAMFGIIVPQAAATFARIQQFAAEHPDQVTVQQSPGSVSITVHGDHAELMPDFGNIVQGMGVVCVLAVLLLAAAVVRRLHDSGRGGHWGLLPLPFLAAAQMIMPQLTPSDFDMRLFLLLFVNNALYLAALAWLVYLLGSRSTPGSNRYGPPPQG